MAAVTTKKPGADVALELTFPAVFQEVYADSGEAERYAPTFPMAPPPMREAAGLQGAYHAQKRQDAHRMVMAALASKHEAERRMLASHANYYMMPKAVLSQRIFANPSLGNISSAIDSARRTMPGSTAPFRCMSPEERSGATGGCGSCYETQLSGGVLFTKTGQEWAAKKLQARVRQLDAIDAAAMSDSLDSGVGVDYKTPEDLQELSLKSQLDMSALFGDLLNSLMAGNVRAIAQYALADLGKLTRLVARWSITATVEEFREALENIDAIYEAVLAQAANEQDIVVEAAEAGAVEEYPAWDLRRVMELIAPRVAALRQYIEEMYAKANLTPKDRKTASKTLLKSTGLTKLAIQPLSGDLRRLLGEVIVGRRRAAAAPEEVQEDLEELADARALNIQRRRMGLAAVDPPNFRIGRFRDDDDDDDEFDAPARPAGAVAAAAAVRAPGGGAPRFDADRRQQMGARHGAFLGEALPELEVLDVPAAINPMRRMAPAGLQPRRVPLDPVFEDMPEEAAAPAARAAPARRRRAAAAEEGEAVGAVARAAPVRAARAPRGARARAAAVVNPREDLRRWFPIAGAENPVGRGKRVAKAKKGRGRTEAEKEAARKKSHEAIIYQQIKAHLEHGDPLPKEAAARLAEFRAAKAKMPAVHAASAAAHAARLSDDATSAMALYPHTSDKDAAAKAAELYSASKRAPLTVEGRKAAMTARVAARVLDPKGIYATPKMPRMAMSPVDVAKVKEAFAAPATAAAPKAKMVLSPSAKLLVDRAKEGKPGAGASTGRGAPMGLTRDTLPKTREGFVELAAKLREAGHNIRVNSGSQLKSIRANFIKKLGL